MRLRNAVSAAVAIVIVAMAGRAMSAEAIKMAIGQRGNWDTAVAEIGQKAGIFAKHGIELETLYTQGGGETMQAVISGSVDVGVAAGTLGVFGAFSKGAPVRIIGAQATGAADFWYVPASSRLRKIEDAGADTTIAYSTSGSSTNSVVLGFINEYNLKAKPVATGSPSATFTQVMTGQVGVGWSSPPFGFEALKDNKIRIIARANDVAAIRTQSIRTLISNAHTVEGRKAALAGFMAAYRETIDFMYASDDALHTYAAFAGTDVATAKQIRDEFFPKSLLDPDKISGLDALMADAITFKMVPAPLDKDHLAILIQIPSRQ